MDERELNLLVFLAYRAPLPYGGHWQHTFAWKDVFALGVDTFCHPQWQEEPLMPELVRCMRCNSIRPNITGAYTPLVDTCKTCTEFPSSACSPPLNRAMHTNNPLRHVVAMGWNSMPTFLLPRFNALAQLTLSARLRQGVI